MLHQWLEHRSTRKTAYTFPHDAPSVKPLIGHRIRSGKPLHFPDRCSGHFRPILVTSPPTRGTHGVPRLFSVTTETAQLRGNGVQVLVRDNNVDQALRALKKKMQREGIFREMKLRGHYEK